ncbi:type IV secretion system DNA-binding domain-containing protein [Nocardioides sp. LHD-245]|uniref:type IV secretory system conjugative DNA transfer family protein n=1 Tax=Nocardioides sp. LHD-245 TaxID=3051387 RepID=UPI0027E0988A|nr:type IV secretion system DNA-binding domain-containing protein [Nocardioides sp. LHD-245]
MLERRASGPFVWTRLDLPRSLPAEQARAALTALAGLSGQPQIVLETTGRDGVVTWKLGTDARHVKRAVAALGAQIPGLGRPDQPSTFDGLGSRVDQAARLRVAGDRRLPLRWDAAEPATRGLLGALAQTRRGELLHLQIILGPRRRPHQLPSQPAQTPREATAKSGEYGFACEVRIGASSRDTARSRSLIASVVSAWRQLEAPGVRLRIVGAPLTTFDQARSSWRWTNTLSVSDLVPLTGWPVSSAKAAPLPGVASPHPCLLAPAKAARRHGRVVGTATARPTQPVALSVDDSLRHLHLIGPTGVGKSTLMANLALQDIDAGRSVVVIDPKGDLVDDILARADEPALDDIVVLDTRSPAPVGINGLAGAKDPDLAADVTLGVLHSLYADAWGVQVQDVLHACLTTLARRGDASLAMVPLLLTNDGFRRSVVGPVIRADSMGLGSFWAWWEALSDAERTQAIAPIMRRLRPILLRPGVRGVLGQRHPRFNLADVFTKRRILLVDLAKGAIGAEAAQLIGSLVVSQLWAAALARAGVPAQRRHPVMVMVDELQDYLRLPGDLSDALAQARGLGVGYTLAHQHLGQLPPKVKAAITANARSRVVFELTGPDAREIAGLTGGLLATEDFTALPAFHAYAGLLDGNQSRPWVSLTTAPLPAPLRDPQLVRQRSAERYGQPLSEVEADLLTLAGQPATGRGGSQVPGEESFGRARHRTSRTGTEGEPT